MSDSLFPSDEEIDRLLVGPESVTWRFASDVRLHSVMLYPLLLQVAHPTVGAGVRDYSDFERRPWDRLMRTVDYVNLLVYGGREAADVGRRLRALHKGFQGTRTDGQRYYALEPEAYAWVHATLLETYVVAHQHFGRPMRPDQVERFYREYRGLGRLVGVRGRDLPEDWASFRRYFVHMCDTVLERNETVERVLRSMDHATPPFAAMPMQAWRILRVPAARALHVGGVGLATPELRARLGLDWSRADEALFQALGAASRRLTPMMPRRLRIMGPGQLRVRRRAIANGPLGPAADHARATTEAA